MNIQTLLIVGIALGIAGCAEKEQASPEAAAEMEPVAPAETEAPVDADATDETIAVIEDWRTSELLDHMHAHAEHLDDVNYALDDDDIERARSAAQWFSRHKAVTDLPSELQPFVDGMRKAAIAVEEATDLDTARAAADQIAAQCRACHAAEGVVTQ